MQNYSDLTRRVTQKRYLPGADAMPVTKEQHIRLGSITITVTRKRVKRINLRVRRDGSVVMSAPPRVPLAELERFAREREDWIERAREDVASQVQTRERSLREGGDVQILDRHFPLHIERDLGPSARPRGELVQDRLVAHVPASCTDDDIPAQVFTAILDVQKKALAEALPPLFEQYEALMGVHASSWRLRTMRSRWGSCNVETGRITLNTELAAHGTNCLRTVVVHELCHLLEPGHGPRFRALMDTYYPAWREGQRELDLHPPVVLA